jgi:hypothetical protein
LRCTVAIAAACGPGEDRVRAEFEQRTGCKVERMKLVEERTSTRHYVIEARCPGGPHVEHSLWMRSGRDQRWVRVQTVDPMSP